MNRTFLALAGTSQSWSAWYHRWFIFCCWIIVVILSLPNLTNAFVMVPHGLITTTTSNSWLLTVVPTPSLARHSSKRRRRSLYMTIPNLPTVEQLLKDPFMKQVQYGSLLTEELIRFENNNNNNNKTNEDEDEESIRQQQQLLSESIQAQLSHPQGIRGFMVSYLTSNENDENENDDDDSTKKTTIPKILLDALKSQAEINPDDLIPLACTYGLRFGLRDWLSSCVLYVPSPPHHHHGFPNSGIGRLLLLYPYPFFFLHMWPNSHLNEMKWKFYKVWMLSCRQRWRRCIMIQN